jgi:hypothetical protein
MSQPLLSILIPTVIGREELFNSLRNEVHTQACTIQGGDNCSGFMYEDFCITGVLYECGVELVYFRDDKSISVGEKRDWLYKKASGIFSWMIDDDDGIHKSAIQLILDAIKSNPETDCIGFKELCNINGEIKYSNFSYGYADWFGDGKLLPDGFHHHRTPFFKTPIRTLICQQVGVADMRYGEDHDFSRRIKPLLKSEVYIDEFIYHYNHISTNHEERYGFNRD